MTLRPFRLAAAVSFFLAACGDGSAREGGEAAAPPGSASSPAAPAPEAAMTPPVPEGLAFRATLPAQAAAGGSVPVTLTLTNTGAAPRDVYLTGREVAFDVVVTAADGTAVWSRLAGEAVPAILQIRTLAAGDSLVFRAAWDGRTASGAPAPPGEYTVRGILPTEEARLETAPVPLRITGG